jgi:hypothetical protein
MLANGRITLQSDDLEAFETGVGLSGEFEVAAMIGDYGRQDNPSIIASLGSATITLEFAAPDDARRLAEQLLRLARTSEEKAEHRGPEFRSRLARDQFMADLKDALKRLEVSVGIRTEPVPVPVFPSKIEQD